MTFRCSLGRLGVVDQSRWDGNIAPGPETHSSTWDSPGRYNIEEKREEGEGEVGWGRIGRLSRG